MDVAIPNNNEKELIDMAITLKIKELLLLYPLNKYDSKKEFSKDKIKVKQGILLEKDGELSKIPQKTLIFSNKPTRMMLESKKVTHVYNLELTGKGDHTHYRNAGMNQVVAKLIKDTKKTLCFSWKTLQDEKNVIGKMMQNNRVARRYELKREVYSFASNPYELKAKQMRESLLNIL